MEKYKVDVPEGKSGDWEIKRFTIDADSAMRSILYYGSRAPAAGDYTKLTRKGETIMSDTGAEIRDHLGFIRQAKGSVLINGLGLGMCLKACLMKKEVTDVSVIELSEDVIKLVSPHYKNDPRIKIIQASAFDYTPPKKKKYDAVWHDIWDNIEEENIPEMCKLHRKYGHKSDWQGSWCRAECERQRKESRQEEEIRILFWDFKKRKRL